MISSVAHLLRLASMVAVGGLLGALVALLLPRSYEAIAYIDVGRVGQIGPIEPTPAVLARINSRAFKLKVIEAIGYKNDGSDGRSEDYISSFFAAPLPRSELVELKSTGKAEDEARRFLSETLRQLKVIHDGMAKPEVDLLRARLTGIDGELAKLQAADVAASRPVDRNNEGSYVVAILMQTVVFEARRYLLEQERQKLLQELSPVKTRPTRFLQDISVRRASITGRIALLGLIGALLGGGMYWLGKPRPTT